jgi:hypothetical protein
MWIHSGNGFASVKSQECLCREVVKISVSAEPRSTNGHEGVNFDKRPVLALELFIPEGRYRIRAPLTPLSFSLDAREVPQVRMIVDDRKRSCLVS